MGLGHSHGHHDHGAAELGDRPLAVAVALNLALTAAQIIGGFFAGSVALIADGVHNLSDALALVLAFGARKLARRPADARMTFGWGRAEIVAAFVNYLALLGISIWLGIEAILRFFDPPPVAGGIVMALAGLAIIINSGTALLTWRMAQNSSNVRAAFLHNLTDAGVSIGVVIGGALIWWLGWRWVDPALTLLISVLILGQVWIEIRPIWRAMLLGAPMGLDRDTLAQDLTALPGVLGIHHLHVWQIDERRLSAELHAVATANADLTETRLTIKRRLAEGFGIHHSTVEMENHGSRYADDLLGNGHSTAHHDHDHD